MFSAVARSARLARPSFLRRGGHGPVSYNEPSGHLFGQKVRVKEDWEDIYYIGMGGGFFAMAVALYYKPDTSLVTWAKKEAEKSLKEKGISLEYNKTSQK